MIENLLQNGKRVVVTGMGFALPGIQEVNGTRNLCVTKEDFWDIISSGKICIENDGIYYGFIKKSEEDLKKLVKYVPRRYLDNYNLTHLLSVISCQEACNDAGLSIERGDFKDAAVITARTSTATNFNSYSEFLTMDCLKTTPQDTLKMFNRLMISVPVNDAALVQAAMLKSGNAQFAVSCGCASGNVAIGLAQKMILTGETDCVVVTGVESIDMETIQQYVDLVEQAEKTGKKASFSAPPTKFLLNKLMAPYDKRAEGYNSGIGSATIILESEEHAIRRNAHIYGEILNQHTARENNSSAVSIDETGESLVRAIKKCLGSQYSLDDIGYINGGAQGDKIFNIFEANALRLLFKEKINLLPVTSQEACFGHNSSALGITGVSGTLLMMNKKKICPTAGCKEKDEICLFDPVPGNNTLEKTFNYALSFNYQAGGVCSVVLLGRY